MLVLTRKLQEQIRIGNDVVITVLQFRGNAVRIGIEAPDHVRILRGELPRGEQNGNVEMTASESATASVHDSMDPKSMRVEIVQMKPGISPVVSSETMKNAGENRLLKNLGMTSPLAKKINARRRDANLGTRSNRLQENHNSPSMPDADSDSADVDRTSYVFEGEEAREMIAAFCRQ